jgi:hypothetical protein
MLAAFSLCGLAGPATVAQGIARPAQNQALIGRWKVTFTFANVAAKNLVLDARANGDASVLLLDSGPDNKPATKSLPAMTSVTTNGRVNFSSEVELPYGTCCQEIGTLIFKGTFGSNNSISGKVIFIGSTEEQENPLGYRSMLGSFSAIRVQDGK